MVDKIQVEISNKPIALPCPPKPLAKAGSEVRLNSRTKSNGYERLSKIGRSRLPEGFFLIELAVAMAIFVFFFQAISLLHGHLYKAQRTILQRSRVVQGAYQALEQDGWQGAKGSDPSISIMKKPIQCVFTPKNQAAALACKNGHISCSFLLKQATVRSEKGSQVIVFGG